MSHLAANITGIRNETLGDLNNLEFPGFAGRGASYEHLVPAQEPGAKRLTRKARKSAAARAAKPTQQRVIGRRVEQGNSDFVFTPKTSALGAAIQLLDQFARTNQSDFPMQSASGVSRPVQAAAANVGGARAGEMRLHDAVWGRQKKAWAATSSGPSSSRTAKNTDSHQLRHARNKRGVPKPDDRGLTTDSSKNKHSRDGVQIEKLPEIPIKDSYTFADILQGFKDAFSRPFRSFADALVTVREMKNMHVSPKGRAMIVAGGEQLDNIAAPITSSHPAGMMKNLVEHMVSFAESLFGNKPVDPKEVEAANADLIGMRPPAGNHASVQQGKPGQDRQSRQGKKTALLAGQKKSLDTISEENEEDGVAKPQQENGRNDAPELPVICGASRGKRSLEGPCLRRTIAATTEDELFRYRLPHDFIALSPPDADGLSTHANGLQYIVGEKGVYQVVRDELFGTMRIVEPGREDSPASGVPMKRTSRGIWVFDEQTYNFQTQAYAAWAPGEPVEEDVAVGGESRQRAPRLQSKADSFTLNTLEIFAHPQFFKGREYLLKATTRTNQAIGNLDLRKTNRETLFGPELHSIDTIRDEIRQRVLNVLNLMGIAHDRDEVHALIPTLDQQRIYAGEVNFVLSGHKIGAESFCDEHAYKAMHETVQNSEGGLNFTHLRVLGLNNGYAGHALLLYAHDPEILRVWDNIHVMMNDDMFRAFLQKNSDSVAIFDYWGHNKFILFDDFEEGMRRLNANLKVAQVIGPQHSRYSAFATRPLEGVVASWPPIVHTNSAP